MNYYLMYLIRETIDVVFPYNHAVVTWRPASQLYEVEVFFNKTDGVTYKANCDISALADQSLVTVVLGNALDDAVVYIENP